MPLPPSVPTGTVTGRWYNRDGSNASGTVVFVPLNEVQVPDDADAVVLATEVTATLSTGEISQELVAGAYAVIIKLTNYGIKRKNIAVAPNEVVNLPDA